MYTKVLDFIKERLVTRDKFCILCLTKEKDRKLVDTSKLQSFLKSIDKQCSWFSKYIESRNICYLCEGRVSRALAVVAAMKNSQQLLSLYHSLEADPNVNSTLHYLDNCKSSRPRNQLSVDLVSAVGRCEERLPAMRGFCNVSVTSTLAVDTNKERRETARCKKNGPSADPLEISNAQVNTYLERARLDKNVTILENKDDLVIIENDITTVQDDAPTRETEDMVVIEDDSLDDSDSEPAQYESSTYVHEAIVSSEIAVQTDERKRRKRSRRKENVSDNCCERATYGLRTRKIARYTDERCRSSTDSDTSDNENRERRRFIERLSRRDGHVIEIPAINPPKLVPLEKLQAPKQTLPILIRPVSPDSVSNSQKTVPSNPIPVNDANKDNFALHPIIHGPDGGMYIPSLNCKFVDGKLEHCPSEVMPPLVNQNVIITNRAPEGSTIMYVTPNGGDPAQPLVEASVQPQLGIAGGAKLVIENGKVSYSYSPPPLVTCAVAPQGGAGAPVPPRTAMATLRPTREATLTLLEDWSSSEENNIPNIPSTTEAEHLSSEILREMLEERTRGACSGEVVSNTQPLKKLSNIGINRVEGGARAAAPALRALAPAPPQPVMKKTVDWEAKIPMEVITYIDAVEPKEKKEVKSPISVGIAHTSSMATPNVVLLGSSSNVYNVIEID